MIIVLKDFVSLWRNNNDINYMIYFMDRKDEFTADMHAEMLENELSYIGVKSLEVYSYILNEGLKLEDACNKAGISVEEYEKGRKEEVEWAKTSFC